MGRWKSGEDAVGESEKGVGHCSRWCYSSDWKSFVHVDSPRQIWSLSCSYSRRAAYLPSCLHAAPFQSSLTQRTPSDRTSSAPSCTLDSYLQHRTSNALIPQHTIHTANARNYRVEHIFPRYYATLPACATSHTTAGTGVCGACISRPVTWSAFLACPL